MTASYRHLLPIATVLFLGLLIYSNSLFVPFVLDDVTSILVNPQIKSFVFSLKTRIVAELSFALNYGLHGLSLPGYHLVNLAIHLVNASLVYILVTKIFRTPLFDSCDVKPAGIYAATAAALLFVAHPLQTGAVTYIAQRVTLLAALFYLLSVMFYLKSRLAAGSMVSAGLIMISIFSAAAAVFSKESAVTLPVTILLCEFSFFRGGLLRRMQWLLYLLPPFALILRFNPAMLFQADIPGAFLAMTAEKGAPSRVEYLFSQFPVLVNYLKLFILPVGQNLDHDMPIKSSFFDPAVFTSFLALVILAGAAMFVLIKMKKVEAFKGKLVALAGFGVLWFFITISLESGLVPMRDLMFEHRMYIPSTGLVLSVSAILLCLFLGGPDERRSCRNFSIGMVALAVLLGVMTFSRNRTWQSEVAIWEDAVRKSPNKGRTHGALGHAYERAKMLQEAEREYVEALRLFPADHIAANNLGSVYLKQKRYPEAVNQFRNVIALVPTTTVAHFNMGLAYWATGSFTEAKSAFEEAIRLKPDYVEARKNLAALERVMAR